MKKKLAPWLSAAAGFGVIYLAGAFICWNLDAGQWTEDARFLTATLGLFVGVLSAAGTAGTV